MKAIEMGDPKEVEMLLKNGETFNDTRQEFYNSEHGVDERGVRALISGRCKSTRGWFLMGVENA